MAALAVSFAVWDPLDIDERSHVHRLTEHSAEGMRAGLEAEMRSLLRAQALLARSWAGRARFTRQDWEREAAVFLTQHPRRLVAELVDDGAGERWRLARGVEDLTRVVLPPVPPWRDLPRGADGPSLSPSFQLRDGRRAAAVVARVPRSADRSAWFVTVIDLETALGEMLSDHRHLGYSIAVREGDDVLYLTPDARPEGENDWAHDAELHLPGVAWRLRVWPDPRLLAQTRSPLPELGVVLGGLLGLLLMPALHFARAAALRSRERKRLVDLTERRTRERRSSDQQADEKLRAEVAERGRAQAALQDLSGRLLRLQDEERRRLARELHDSTAQALGAVAVVLDRARRSVRDGGRVEVDAVIEEGAGLIGQVTQEIRTLSFLLHPPMLDDLGLEYAIPWYAEGFGRRSGIAVSVDVPRELGRLPEDVELTLYRIVQEALANVHHHSGSTTASITLFRDAGSVTLEIKDQGCGLRGQLGAAAELGVGIPGMRERVRQLGGKLDIRDEGGTIVRVVLPLRAADTLAAKRGAHDFGVAV